ncbi:Uncharacterised protein [Candidatus Venteria ishoeyi]|uniref:Uncharacterized protein n=1 Tax=Candidatus Venteria ishoeyi TaxID=1899563 RepID=A0A1H6F5X2_9GAMM|nr:Uncharacterised protein [Candidatus Venteria ishoeyi]
MLVLFIKFPKVKEKDYYVRTTYSKLSNKIFALDMPGELLSKLSSMKDVIALKPMSKSDIITKVGSRGYVKIHKNPNIITNIGMNKKKKVIKKKVVKKEGPKHIIYYCNKCNSNFRRFTSSKTKLQCPYCSSKNISFVSKDYSTKKYDGKRIKKKR